LAALVRVGRVAWAVLVGAIAHVEGLSPDARRRRERGRIERARREDRHGRANVGVGPVEEHTRDRHWLDLEAVLVLGVEPGAVRLPVVRELKLDRAEEILGLRVR